MARRVRIGVVGTSWWADLVHLPSLRSHPRAKIVSICGRNPDRARRLAQKYEVPRIFTDYREMIEGDNLDAVVVACPDDLHYPVTMKALEKGLHVVCEKPLALNSNQAREMYEKAEAVGVKHMVFFTSRWVPHCRYLKELLDEGFIGHLYHCHIHRFAGYGREPLDWRFDPGRSNGILGDLGSHSIDLARWFFGKITTVSASLATFLPDKEGGNLLGSHVNNSAVLSVQFENGGQGILHASGAAHVGDRERELHVLLHGEAGTLQARLTFAGAAIEGIRANEQGYKELPMPDSIWGRADRNQPFIAQRRQIFTSQAVGDRLFIDAIVEDRPVVPNFYDGLVVQEVMDAAIESHERGTRIPVPGG